MGCKALGAAVTTYTGCFSPFLSLDLSHHHWGKLHLCIILKSRNITL